LNKLFKTVIMMYVSWITRNLKTKKGKKLISIFLCTFNYVSISNQNHISTHIHTHTHTHTHTRDYFPNKSYLKIQRASVISYMLLEQYVLEDDGKKNRYFDNVSWSQAAITLQQSTRLMNYIYSTMKGFLEKHHVINN
jgi:hypothetical protein